MMTDERHVDGNAMGGMLVELLGREMTDARGCCDHCGAIHELGRILVYQGMGDVMRCPTCHEIVLVAVTVRKRTRLYLDGLRWLEPVTS